MKTIFKNVRVLDVLSGSLKNCCVLVEDDKIKKIGDDLGIADTVIDGKNHILMSGFVNSHAHNPMSLLRNLYDDLPLDKWLFDHILPTEAKLTRQDIYWGEMLSIAEGVRNGITSFEECYFFQEEIVKAVQKAKVRARIGLGKAIGGTDLESDIRKIFNLCKDNPLITNMIYSHSIYTYSLAELEIMVMLANELSLPLSIHLSETLKEVGECDVEYGKSPVGFLETVGYFDKPCLAYHCVHCDKDDMDILKRYDVSVATCPSSNIKLASGIAPIYSFLQKGINVCIGTDGPGSNNCLDMFKEMFLVASLSKVNIGMADVVKANEVLMMATINGAKALGYKNVGLVKEGYQADLILVDTDNLHYIPENNIMSSLVYCGRGSDVRLTMVAGNILYQDGQYFIGEDIDKIKFECEKISKRLKGN